VTRQRALVALAALVAVVTGVGGYLLIWPATDTPGSVDRPNIVLLTTDDMTQSDLVAMPTVRRLIANHGARFENSFAPNPLCCPARASTLTGQYSHNHGVLNNDPALGGGFDAFEDRTSLATWLQEAGYRTGFIGKYLNGYQEPEAGYVPPGWDDWNAAVAPWTYAYFHQRLSENGEVVRYPERYSSFLYADKTAEFVEESMDGDEPFFLWTSFVAPHNGGPEDPDDPRAETSDAPGTPSMPLEYRDLFAGWPLPQPRSVAERDLSDKPGYIRNSPPVDRRRARWLTEVHQQRLESLAATDEAVRRIVTDLRERELLEKTLLIFTSDNGWMNGEHRAGGKIKPYEPSLRVPLLVRGPGVEARLRIEEMVGTIDLAPTITAAAGARAGLPMDGLSLLPLLRGEEGLAAQRRALVIEGGSTTEYRRLAWVGLRTPRWTYVEYADGQRELYDLLADPHQLHSRHDDPRYGDVEERLAARLERLRHCSAESCRG